MPGKKNHLFAYCPKQTSQSLIWVESDEESAFSTCNHVFLLADKHEQTYSHTLQINTSTAMSAQTLQTVNVLRRTAGLDPQVSVAKAKTIHLENPNDRNIIYVTATTNVHDEK